LILISLTGSEHTGYKQEDRQIHHYSQNNNASLGSALVLVGAHGATIDGKRRSEHVSYE
jgi:hypothetical protein